MAHASPHGAADGLSFFSFHPNFPRPKRLVPELQERMRLQIAGRSRHFRQIYSRGRILNCPLALIGMETPQGYWQCLADRRSFERLASATASGHAEQKNDIVLSLMHKIWQRDTQLSIHRWDSTQDVVTSATAFSNHRTKLSLPAQREQQTSSSSRSCRGSSGGDQEKM